MSEARVVTFEESLRGLGVGSRRTRADGFEEALRAEVAEPVVGAPLPFDDLSLPDWVPVHPTPRELGEAATGVTAAGAAIAEYGTLLVQSRPGGDEPVSLYPERHVAVVRESDLVERLSGAISWLGEELGAGRDCAVLATGVSATADMGEFVEGVHGPGDVRVVIVTDR